MENFNKERAIGSARDLFDLLDRYLVEDLKFMVEEVPKIQTRGIGYPAIHTIVSGMELLGLCMSGEEGRNAFNHFWSNYFVKNFPEYENLDTVFYEVIRNGTAHLYFVKAGVSVSNSNLDSSSNHLKPRLENGKKYLNVDLKKLLDHFLLCYKEIKGVLLTSQKEDILSRFWIGYSKLFEQMRRAAEKVEKLFESRDLKTPSPDLGSDRIVYDVNRSTISGRTKATITEPPEHWLKGNENNPNEDR